jgi:hypothetical protein
VAVQPSFDELLHRLDHLSTQFEDLREGIRKAITIAELDPEMSLTRARKVLEYIVRQVYESRTGEEAGTRPLENLLQRLTRDGHLPRKLAAYANAVRELGNVGTHAFEPVTPRDVLQSLNQLLQIVEWYFEQSGPAPAAAQASAGAPPAPGPAGALPLPRPAGGRPFRNSLGNQLLAVPAARCVPGLPADVWVSATCVSNGDYLEFVQAGGPEPRGSPSTPTRRSWHGKSCPEAIRDHPVLYISHADARLFCEWLTEREQRQGRLGGGLAYRLPSLAQWKAWAASDTLPRDAVTDRDWRPGETQPTVPVSWGEPSALGLYHLFGNVFQWCLDASEKDGTPYHAAVGGGWASTRRWLEREIGQGTGGAIWRRRGLPMKDGGFRVCLF